MASNAEADPVIPDSWSHNTSHAQSSSIPVEVTLFSSSKAVVFIIRTLEQPLVGATTTLKLSSGSISRNYVKLGITLNYDWNWDDVLDRKLECRVVGISDTTKKSLIISFMGSNHATGEIYTRNPQGNNFLTEKITNFQWTKRQT